MRVITVFLILGVGLATADTFLIKSTDGGRNWTDIDPGPPHQILNWLRVDPGTSTLYALTGNTVVQLLVSTDRGQTWHARQTFTARTQPNPGGGVLLLSLPWNIRAAATPGTVYLAYPDLDPRTSIVMFKVTNAGSAMEQYPAQGLTIERPEPGPNYFQVSFMDLAADPAEPSALYALVANLYGDSDYYGLQALWRSENGGRNWRRLEPPVRGDCNDAPEFRIDPSGSPAYLLCGSDLFKSTDRGDSWTRTSGPDGGPIRNLVSGLGSPGTLYGLRSDEIWKSTDAGQTWQRAGTLPGISRLQAHPTNPSVILATGSRGIHQSEDGGATWSTLLAAQLDYPALGVSVDPRAPNAVYSASLQRLELRLDERQTFLRNLLGERLVAPGSLVSIYGRDLARETRVADSTPLPVSLGGASVLFNGRLAPLLFASPGQINAQVPFGLQGPVAMEVRRADATVDRQTITLFSRGAVILRENLTRQETPLLFHASDFRRVTADDPARPGEALIFFAVGMGELEPAIRSGELPPTPPPQLRDSPCVVFSERLGGRDRIVASMPPLWAGAAPGWIGLYQVNLEVPTSLSPGSYTVSLSNRPPVRAPFTGECRVDFQVVPLDSVTLVIQ